MQGLAKQHEQAERSQRAVQAEWRAELVAVREGLELRTAQLHAELVAASQRLEKSQPLSPWGLIRLSLIHI